MIEERCIRCGEIIVGGTRARFQKRYSEHVTERHGKPKTAKQGARP